jgi:hypothetical protein
VASFVPPPGSTHGTPIGSANARTEIRFLDVAIVAVIVIHHSHSRARTRGGNPLRRHCETHADLLGFN